MCSLRGDCSWAILHDSSISPIAMLRLLRFFRIIWILKHAKLMRFVTLLGGLAVSMGTTGCGYAMAAYLVDQHCKLHLRLNWAWHKHPDQGMAPDVNASCKQCHLATAGFMYCMYCRMICMQSCLH